MIVCGYGSPPTYLTLCASPSLVPKPRASEGLSGWQAVAAAALAFACGAFVPSMRATAPKLLARIPALHVVARPLAAAVMLLRPLDSICQKYAAETRAELLKTPACVNVTEMAIGRGGGEGF